MPYGGARRLETHTDRVGPIKGMAHTAGDASSYVVAHDAGQLGLHPRRVFRRFRSMVVNPLSSAYHLSSVFRFENVIQCTPSRFSIVVIDSAQMAHFFEALLC